MFRSYASLRFPASATNGAFSYIIYVQFHENITKPEQVETAIGWDNRKHWPLDNKNLKYTYLLTQ